MTLYCYTDKLGLKEFDEPIALITYISQNNLIGYIKAQKSFFIKNIEKPTVQITFEQLPKHVKAIFLLV